MSYFLIFLSLLINSISTQTNSCLILNNKLTKYDIHIAIPENTFNGLKLCQNFINDSCCPQIYEDQIQNATSIELYQLFELYSIDLYEPLLRLTNNFNNTINQLIELSRNETYLVFQRNSSKISFHSSLELFFNNLLTLTHKTYQYDIQNYVEELFRQILRLSIEFNNENQSRISTYFLCLWRNHPFGNRPNILAKQLEMNLGKLLHLNELLKLSIELVQFMSMSVTTDNHCIDSYLQLTYCNLCSGRTELPCLSNCINIIESCLVNITLINNVWTNFIDSLENISYFNGIEKALSSISTSIFDAIITYFNSDGILNQDIINQCGSVPLRKEIFDHNQKFQNDHRNSLSILDEQLMSMKESLKKYRSFWLILPDQICQSNGISASNENLCWTGTRISNNNNQQSIQTHYDKPLSLRLQWLLKEIREKSQIIGNIQQIPLDNSTVTNKTKMLSDTIKFSLPDGLDDYPNDDELHYSDYAYEDAHDESISSTTFKSTPTIPHVPTVSLNDDTLFDDINTVSYYDYAESDVYNDDQNDASSTRQSSSSVSSTMTKPIPSHHQRQPIIWNINIDKDNFVEQSTQKYNSCFAYNYSFRLTLFLLLILLT